MSNQTKRQIILLAIFAIIVIAFASIFKVAIVQGQSMLPTFRNGEVVIVNKLSTNLKSLKRGDVVILHTRHDDLIKRIAYLPGHVIPYPYSLAFRRVWKYFDVIHKHIKSDKNEDHVDIKVPPGYIVVLGDNLEVSDDSRYFGPLPLQDIEGKVIDAPPAPYHL